MFFQTKNFLKIILFTLLICLTISCWPGKPSEVTDEIFGTYVFKFPSNEIQVLTIRNDSTYGQKIYRNIEGFKNKSKPLYVNNGKWTTSKKVKLNFDNWLEYSYMRYPDSILPRPNYVLMTDVYWDKPNRKHNGLISIYYETGYVFRNIDDWESNEEE